MRPLLSLLSELRRRGIRLTLRDDEVSYRAPPGQMTPELLRELRAKRDAIVLYLQSIQPPSRDDSGWSRASRDGALRLSPSQVQLWLIDQLEPDSPAYHVPKALSLRGELDPGRLEAAIRRTVARHEILRARIEVVDGHPRMVIGDQLPRLVRVDAVGRTDAEIEELCGELVGRPFDLSERPPVRTWLVHRGKAHSVFLVALHHLFCDGPSLSMLTTEITQAYTAPNAPVPELEWQYADYAARQWSRPRGSPRLGVEELAGCKPIDLRHGLAATRGGWVQVAIPRPTRRLLEDAAHRASATPAMAMLALFQLALRTEGAPNRFAVAVPVDRRTTPLVRQMLGYFVETVPVACDIGGRPSFEELLVRTRQTLAAALARQDVPYPELVRALRRDPRVGRADLVRAMFAYSREASRTAPPGLEVRDLDIPLAGAKFDVTLDVRPSRGQWMCRLAYDGTNCPKPRAERILARLVRAAGHVCDSGHLPVTGRALLTDDEVSALAGASGGTPVLPASESLVDRVDRWASDTPNAVAVIAAEGQLDYASLVARSRVEAAAIRDRVPDGPVLIERARGLDVVVTMLACLRAGVPFAPISIHWPERLRLTARATLSASFRATTGASTHPKQPMYVMFTSGTTGRPRGVAVPYEGVENRFRWMDAHLGPELAASVLQTTPHVHDSAVWQLLWPLTHGGRTVIPEPGFLPEARTLADTIHRHGISLLDLVPSVFTAVVDPLCEAGEALRPLRGLILGGEAIDPVAVQQFARRFSDVRILNLYGPTEASIGCIFHEIDAVADADAIPIGLPIPGVVATVLDEDGEPRPPGVPGELFVGGPCLANGYCNDPRATARAFVPNADGTTGARRLYRTGDLASFDEAGRLWFRGRLDDEVKIRGHRIALSSVRLALRALDGVLDAAVVRDGDRGDLVAAVALARHHPTRDFSHELSGSLPAAHIPTRIVQVDSLPVTPVGKVDRQAIVDLVGSTHRRPASPSRALTPHEEVLATIWQDLLGAPCVDANADFFALGGHSLLLIQLAHRIETTIGTRVPLRVLFEHATLEDQASAVQSGGQPTVARLPVEDTDTSPTTRAQRRMLVLDRLGRFGTAYRLQLGLHLPGDMGAAQVLDVLERLRQRHPALRTVFSADGSTQRVSNAATPAWRELDLRDLPPDALAAEAHTELHAPFDPSASPPWRAALLTQDSGRVLVLTAHHAVVDGWSINVLAREFWALGRELRGGPPADLSPTPCTPGRYARWEQSVLDAATFENRLDRWRDALAGLPPVDTPVIRSPQDAARTTEFRISPALTSACAGLARDNQATLYMVLAAVYHVLLYRLTGEADRCVASPVAARPLQAMADMVGCVANTVLVRADLSKNPTSSELLVQVRQTCLRAFEDEAVPFEEILRCLPTPVPSWTGAYLSLDTTPYTADGEGPRATTFPRDDVRFAVGLDIVRHADGGLACRLECGAAPFDVHGAPGLGDRFVALLRALVDGPEAPVCAFEILLDHEWTALAPRTRADPPAPLPWRDLGEGVLHWAHETPDAPAVSDCSGTWTYRELAERACGVAGAIVERGAVVGDCIAVDLPAGRHAVAALVGVLVAGCHYVVLEAGDPEARRTRVVDAAGARLVLGDGLESSRFGIPLVDLAKVDPAPADRTSEAAGELPAYAMFTSGSSGVPKGVLVSHQNVLALFAGARERLPVHSPAVWTVAHSMAFDLSVWEMFGPLLSGDHLAVLPRKVALEPDRLMERLTHHRASIVSLTPTAAGLLDLDALPSSVRTLFVGGEALGAPLARRLARARPDAWTLYGPTEATVWSTASPIDEQPVHLGDAFEGEAAMVLDAHGTLCPTGTWGELCLAGSGVSIGYVGQPRATAERFRPDPYTGAAGARLYRTGDRARRLLDGRLEFGGRLDRQVKIRGHRVELGEITSALLAHPNVDSAVVDLRAVHGQDELVAWIVPSAGSTAEDRELRPFLRARLPAHMLPARFVEVPSIPQTHRGKRDTSALPEPPAPAPRPRPLDPIGRACEAAWLEALGRGRVDGPDHFFELGGQSIRAVQASARVNELLDIEVESTVLFDNPTFEEFVDAVRDSTGRHQPTEDDVASDAGPFELTANQLSLWHLDALVPGLPALSLVPSAVQVRGKLDLQAMCLALEALTDRHEALRSRVSTDGDGRVVQTVLPSDRPEVALWNLRHQSLPAADRARLARRAATRPMNLDGGKLFRAELFLWSDEDTWVVLTCHHCITDGWSMAVLWRDLATAYALQTGEGLVDERRRAPSLAEIHAYAKPTGRRREEALAYWVDRLVGPLERLTWPGTDGPQSRIGSELATVALPLGPPLGPAIRALANQTECTPFTAFVALVGRVLADWTGSHDIRIGTHVLNREHGAMAQAVGLLANTVVLRLHFVPNASLAEAGRRTRAELLNAQAHGHLPFSELTTHLAQTGQASSLALFEVMCLHLVDTPAPSMTPSLSVESMDLRLAQTQATERTITPQSLVFEIVEQESTLRGRLRYRADLFSPEEIQHLLRLLVSRAEGP